MKRIACLIPLGLLSTVWLSVQSSPLQRPEPFPLLTAEQESLESQVIQQQFYKHPCFQELRNTTNAVRATPSELAFYSVAISSTPVLHDAFEYVIHVNRRDRSVYLQRFGGFAGVNEMHGPIEFRPCLKKALSQYSSASGGAHEIETETIESLFLQVDP